MQLSSVLIFGLHKLFSKKKGVYYVLLKDTNCVSISYP